MPNPPNVRSNSLPLWEALYAVLNAVEERNDPEFTRAVFLVVLLEAHKALERQDFDYPVLPRVSLEQTLYAVKTLLACSREGEHAMSLAAALFTVVGRRFGLWDVVSRQTSTTSDAAVDSVGDLECRKDNVLVYAVEVKERSINVADIRSFENKLNQSEVTEALISAPAVLDSEADVVDQRIRLMWGRGINVYRLWIPDLVSVCLSLAGEQGRGDFVSEVGKQLDQYGRTFGRGVWRDCLNEILDGLRPS